jgi:hypothetical protein
MWSCPRCFEVLGRLAVETLVEMGIYVENGLDAGMPESRCNDCRMSPLFDQEGHVAVP